MYPFIAYLLQFLLAFYDIFLYLDEQKLNSFIEQYQNDENEEIALFASGLKKDLTAVLNSLLYPQISNGPLEGTNNKIKMVRKRGYGRAGPELLNALMVLPWYYKDLDAIKRNQDLSIA